ncbi:hypothetical protein B0T11DRAFT_330963 [Plectosphaerella cucumerina]|uniref:Uncharacterized protein n=1 Tax=Plectosphaerella cucumerina TaxID=40658 RepID=A0A8K0X216_9PEZI|nr:hypothetical protein B0T11DRAFT_330963 [Plectosphaerella cucumerina]
MKVAYFLLSALATVAIAAPSATTGDEIMVENLEKRQICSGACENGKKRCYNCINGGGDYEYEFSSDPLEDSEAAGVT